MKQFFSPDDELISFTEFSQLLFSPIVPIEEIKDFKGNPISQLFPYWRRHNLLPFIPKGKWNIQISFAQLIWLRILDTFREFSVSKNAMLKVCDYFFKDAYHDDLPKKNLLANKAIIEKRRIAGIHSEDDDTLLFEIEKMLSDNILLYGLKFEINYLTKLITDCISSELDAGFLIFANGDVYEYIGEQYFSHRKTELDLRNPHIKLSIQYYLKEFIQEEALQKLYIPRILNDDEKEVLKALRQNNTCISIKMKENKILKIDSTNEGVISEEKAKEIMQLLGLKNYEEIKISTRDKKTLTFKKTYKNNRLR